MTLLGLDRPRRTTSAVTGTGLLVSVAALLVVASVAATASRGIVDPGVALAFGAFVALGEFIRVTMPGDRSQAPLGLAGGLSYAFVVELPGRMLSHDPLQVVAVTATGMVLGAVPHVVAGRVPAIEAVARRILVVAFAAAIFRPLADRAEFGQSETPWLPAAVMLLVAVACGALDAAMSALVAVDRAPAPYLPTARNELKAIVGIGAAVGSTGLLVALAGPVMGLWAIPVLCVPLLLTQFSFRRYAGIRSTYLQTVRSLSRVTDLGGYTETGHSRRVSQLAVALGRDLGMGDDDLRDLEYAALMHDIGQLSLQDPIPGGATLMVSEAERMRIAALGAEVIRQTGVLDKVATLVERQAMPYRRPHQQDDPDVPLGSRIIRVVNAYDDLVGDALEMGRTLDALERLRLGVAYDYDPRVVDSLSNVLSRVSAA